MTAPKPKPRGGQRRAVGRQYSAPKATSRKRFERQLRTYWGSSWLVALLANLAAAAGPNTLGPPPLERPQDPPARESSGVYDSDASLGSICDFIVGWNEARRHKKNGRRFGRKLRLRSFHRLEEVMCLLQKLHAQPEEGRGLPFKNDRHDHARARGRGAPSEVLQISAMRGDFAIADFGKEETHDARASAAGAGIIAFRVFLLSSKTSMLHIAPSSNRPH